jgi:hypothetical protein
LSKLGQCLVELLQPLLIAVGVLSALFGELRNAIAICPEQPTGES